MLIEKFIAPASELVDVGLQPIEMNRLGRFVALTGKNGAGKSRILTKLHAYTTQRNQYIDRLAPVRENILNYQTAINNHPSDDRNQAGWKQQLKENQTYLCYITERIHSSINSSLGVLYFVPKQLVLHDPRQKHKADLQNLSDKASDPGFGGFEHTCFSYIQILQNREREVTHPQPTHDYSFAEIADAKDKYEQLVSTIELLLKAKIGRSKDGDVMLFGKPLAGAHLSDGQKVLIQLAVALHAQNGKLDNTVFLMDEPENHLHPSALIEFLDILRDVAGNAQFWIATHSVPLLAHIARKEPMSIWYVEEGKVSNAGSKPEKVLRGLLGNDEQIGNLNAFTSLPAQYAAISFAAECLTAPKTVDGGAGDPQVAQIGGLLGFDSNAPVSLLDFGAGKSRLLYGLDELATAQGMKLSDSVSYFAFDSSENDRATSVAAIDKIYSGDQTRHFLSANEFFSSKDDASIDVVVICNVLHEIPPNEWLKLFDEHSLIDRSLKDAGHLLVVEDQRIPTGERAHKFGFMVLDTPHLRTLFSVKEDDDRSGLFQAYDHRGDGRLKAHKISKNLLARLSTETRKRAIEQLRETAKVEINSLRQADSDYRNGQLHGFWTQQFANASLWLDEH